ncbi:phage protein [Escherichia coli]|nr:phage protein [Escherichia coli]
MSKCQKCNNTGMCDSGGSTPWGEPIFIECDCLMKDDESRCQFEESWLRRGGESSDLIRYPENHHEIGSGDIGGQYVMDDVQGHWQTWQASRAAIEIELQKPKKGPLPGDYHIGYDSGAESQYESDVEAIRTAGVKVKE